MPSSLKFKAADSDTEPTNNGGRSLIELMREATDGSGSFMSRRAQQILWENFRIAVVTCMASIAIKACVGRTALMLCSGVAA